MNTIRPLDRLFAVYNLVLIGVWTPHLGSAPVATWIVLAHLIALALPWGLVRVARSGNPVPGILREIYPWVAFVLFWSELGLLQTLRPGVSHDTLVAALDLRIFGTHLHEIWSPALPAAWFREFMFGSYLSYYFLVFAPVLFAGLTGRKAMFRDMTVRLLATYLACDLLYALFPVYGPRFGADPGSGAFPPGFFHDLAEGLRASGDSPGTAFPSSHVAGVFTALILAFRWFPRPLVWIWGFGALGVAVATIYTRNHLTVDVFAGVLLAGAIQITVSRSPVHVGAGPLRPAFPRLVPGQSSTSRAGGGS